MQQLHRLSVVGIPDESVLVHDQVARCVEGQNDGLGAGGAVEADEGTVSVVELGVGSVERNAVEDDAGVFELQDKGGEGACALGDCCGFRDRSRGGWSGGGGGGVGGADAGTGAGITDCTGTCGCVRRDGRWTCCHLAWYDVEDRFGSSIAFRFQGHRGDCQRACYGGDG